MENLILEEIAFNHTTSYPLGKYLYLGMAKKQDKKVCISVGYKLDYCIKKVDEFLALDSDIVFSHISKIKVGELKACQKFYINTSLKNYY